MAGEDKDFISKFMTKSGQSIFKPALAKDIFSEEEFRKLMLLKNKVSVITGCNRGIGKSILETFSQNGSSIFACVRNIDDDFLEFIGDLEKKNNNKIVPISFNLENIEEVKNAAKSIINQNKNLDILVNNAGIIDTFLFQMTTEKSLKKMFEINFFLK